MPWRKGENDVMDFRLPNFDDVEDELPGAAAQLQVQGLDLPVANWGTELQSYRNFLHTNGFPPQPLNNLSQIRLGSAQSYAFRPPQHPGLNLEEWQNCGNLSQPSPQSNTGNYGLHSHISLDIPRQTCTPRDLPWQSLVTRHSAPIQPNFEPDSTTISLPDELQKNKQQVRNYNTFLNSAFAGPASQSPSSTQPVTQDNLNPNGSGLYATHSSVRSQATSERKHQSSPPLLHGGANLNHGGNLTGPHLSNGSELSRGVPSISSMNRSELTAQTPSQASLQRMTTGGKCGEEGGLNKFRNQRKTEQNRQAQARFRKKRKERNHEQEQAIEELNNKLETAAMEKKQSEELVLDLRKRLERAEDTIAEKNRHIQALTENQKSGLDIEGVVSACWELYNTLRRGGSKMNYTRPDIFEMVQSMLDWGSTALGFLRRDLKTQLAKCLESTLEQQNSPEYFWLCELIEAYELMLQKIRKCHPSAFAAFMRIQLPEQKGKNPDSAIWQDVLEKGSLEPNQREQLVSARNNLSSKLLQSQAKAQKISEAIYSDAGVDKNAFIDCITQSQEALDSHAQLHKEKAAAVFSFMNAFRLVVQPEQYARLLVASFPFSLDTLALCDLIAKQDTAKPSTP